MKKFILFLIISFAILFIYSCETVRLDSRGYEHPAALNAKIGQDYKMIAHFREDTKAVFLIFNLITVKNPDIQKIIDTEVAKVNGDGSINIKIIGQTQFIDGFVPVALELGGMLISPSYGSIFGAIIGLRTYTVEGDIIKLNTTEGSKWTEPVDKEKVKK